VSGWASLPSVPDADLERRVQPEVEPPVVDEEQAGGPEDAEPTPDLRDPRNRDNWRVENWHIP
jgi:hypothetical protein